MKISAWHKKHGDFVEWYNPMISGHMDKVYKSKVFSFSDDYLYHIDADEIIEGGSGYCINNVDGIEVYDKSKDIELPYEIEHIYPDYSIKVADLEEFWQGQKNIVICDPNILACRQWKDLLQQLIDSKALININQGMDIRLMTEAKAEMIKKIKLKTLHFAWDRYEDKNIILPKLKMFKYITGIDIRKLIVYVLCNYDTTIEQDLERIYTLREMGYWGYAMIYDKESLPKGHVLRKMERWVNNRFIFASCDKFEDYLGRKK